MERCCFQLRIQHPFSTFLLQFHILHPVRLLFSLRPASLSGKRTKRASGSKMERAKFIMTKPARWGNC